MNWTFHKKKESAPGRYHEVDSFHREEGTFDEARYYEGDQFELGGVDFGFDRTQRPNSEGWRRPGLHSHDYGFKGTAEKFAPHEPYFDRSTKSEKKSRHQGKGPKGYQRSDERIFEEVSEALFRSGDVDAREIIVDVQQGYVYLRGSVESRRTKKLAEGCIENISGVKDVMNELFVKESALPERLTEKEIQDLDRFRIA
jgi:hypothetical protein